MTLNPSSRGQDLQIQKSLLVPKPKAKSSSLQFAEKMLKPAAVVSLVVIAGALLTQGGFSSITSNPDGSMQMGNCRVATKPSYAYVEVNKGWELLKNLGNSFLHSHAFNAVFASGIEFAQYQGRMGMMSAPGGSQVQANFNIFSALFAISRNPAMVFRSAALATFYQIQNIGSYVWNNVFTLTNTVYEPVFSGYSFDVYCS